MSALGFSTSLLFILYFYQQHLLNNRHSERSPHPPRKVEVGINQPALCIVMITLQELSLNVQGTQKEEPGSDKDGRECQAGQVFLVGWHRNYM